MYKFIRQRVGYTACFGCLFWLIETWGRNVLLHSYQRLEEKYYWERKFRFQIQRKTATCYQISFRLYLLEGGARLHACLEAYWSAWGSSQRLLSDSTINNLRKRLLFTLLRSMREMWTLLHHNSFWCANLYKNNKNQIPTRAGEGGGNLSSSLV